MTYQQYFDGILKRFPNHRGFTATYKFFQLAGSECMDVDVIPEIEDHYPEILACENGNSAFQLANLYAQEAERKMLEEEAKNEKDI